MKQVERIYLSGPISKGVAESQMINWAKLLEERYIYTRFLVFYNKSNQKKYERMNVMGIHSDFTVKKYINYPFVRELTYFFCIRSLLRNSYKTRNVIIQTRTSSFALPIYFLRLFYSFKIIYEIRGTGEELIRKKWTRDFQNKLNDRLMLKMSQKIIAVSKKLLDYKITNYNLNDIRQKSLIIYGAADSGLFFYDPDLREKMRKELQLTDRYVILYVGMLDKEWQIPDVTFKLVAELMKEIKNLFFLVITPDWNIAEPCRLKHGLSDSDVIIRESSQKDLNGYINAADIGLLLREDTLVNHVAAPTKFAEYLLGGLPVIISKNVGDYSEFTEENKVGLVIDLKKPCTSLISQKMINDPHLKNRKQIGEIGNKHLSKQHFVDLLAGIY